MGEFFKLILPVILQLLPQLFNKSKAAMSEWFDKGKDAALAEKKPWSAFWMGSMKCAFDGMSEDRYGDVQLAVDNAGEAMRAIAKQTAASRAAKGGAS